mmetsp:Transcript_26506/g.106145  ORF Transcript_26506/g.106145 Transcript_26506/m.106145 type:complete len:84 (-) Transcript_26506:100-351(-)
MWRRFCSNTVYVAPPLLVLYTPARDDTRGVADRRHVLVCPSLLAPSFRGDPSMMVASPQTDNWSIVHPNTLRMYTYAFKRDSS